jgi:hypothetical protein
MKRKETKSNNSKHPVKKLIALWVVFALLIVPFANHVGDKNGAKAEGGSATGGVKVVTDSSVGVTVDVSEKIRINKDDTGAIVTGTSKKTVYLLEGVQSVTKLKLPELKSNATDLALLGAAFYGADKSVDLEVTSSLFPLGNNGETDLQANAVKENGKIGIYARAKDTDSWKLQCVVNVVCLDTVFTGIAGLYGDNAHTDKLTADRYVNEAYIGVWVDPIDIPPNTSLKYYVKTDNPATSEELVNVASYTWNSWDFKISADAENNGKQVYAYAALIDNASSQVLEYIDAGTTHISNDAQAPTISKVTEEQSEDGNVYVAFDTGYTDDNGVYYGNKNYYRFTVKVEDVAAENQDASGVKNVTAYLNGDTSKPFLASKNAITGNYEITIQKTDLAEGDNTITVTAEDNKGNKSETFTYPVKLHQVTDSTEIKSVKFLGEDGDLLISDAIIREPKTIEITLESTKNVGKVEVKSGDDVSFADVAPVTNAESVKRVYSVTAKIQIPTDANIASTNFSGLKIAVYEKDTNTILLDNKSIKDIMYDATAPEVKNPVIQKKKNGSSTWEDVADGSLETAIVTELDTEYRYMVEVTDDLSGVAKVSSDKGDFTFESGNKYVFNIPSGELNVTLPYSVAVSAIDNAGNPSTTLTLRGVTKIDDTLRVDNCVIIDAAGNDVTSDVLAGKNTNKKYQLQVTASSAYVVKKFELIAGGTNDQVKDVADSDNDKNPDSHRYSTTVKFELPAKTNINAQLDSMYLNVIDGNAQKIRYPQDASKTLGTILYDRTNPTVSINEANESTWYKEYTINYTITSGDNGVESPLANAGYSLAGSKANVTDKEIALNGTQTSVNGTIAIPESAGITGTSLVFNAQDASENLLPNNLYKIKVDKTKPKAELTVNGKTNITQPLDGEVLIKTTVSDNLTINQATITVKGPDTDVTTNLSGAKELVNVSQENSFTLNNLIGKKAADGDYTVTVNVSDKAGNIDSKTMKFRVDNTIPVVTAKISGGTTAGKQPGKNFDGTVCDYFYRSNVTIELTYEDENISASDVRVTDNNNVVNVTWQRIGTSNKYRASYVSTGIGARVIKINAQDNAGNNAVEKQVVFIKDTEAPNIAAVINGGMVYSENMGVVDLTSDATVAFSVSDANEDVHDFNYQLIKTVPDQLPVTADVLKTDNRVFGYTDEADYQVKVYSVDKAGNRSAERNVQFRVDKTAPELQITGTASGSTLNAGTTLTFSMTEAFWWDASGTITITRKANDSVAEAAYKTIDFKPTARVTTMTETLSETGEYQVTFTGKDRAGHTAEATSYTVRIDTGKPIITLSGVSNNDKTTKQVEFQAQIEEDFYLTKSVRIQATRTYLDPTSYKEKTEDLQITGYNPTAATTLIRNTFTEDGIYKIQINCKDAAGNEDTQEVSFTIDKTKPVIDPKVMSAYEGTLTSFAWDYDLNDIIYDLTVCDAHMYLNGSEYDGTSEVEDGAYEMKITAEDELGNATEKTVNFNLDTKAPTFIVTGVEDGEIKNEQYDINVSLQLDEDTLDEVTLNGSPVEIKDNAAAITVTEKGDYKLTMKAHDDAGNEAEQTISFTYGEKSHVLLYVLIGVGVLAVLGGGIAIILAAKKKKNN